MSQTAIEYIITGRNTFFASKVDPQVFPKAEYRENATYTLCMTGLNAPFGNAIWQPSSSCFKEQDIQHILEAFQSKEIPFFWWEAPIPLDSEIKANKQSLVLKEILVKHGLQVGGLLTGVCASLNAPLPILKPLDDITIRPAQTSEELRLFCQLIFTIHHAPAIIEEAYRLAEKAMHTKEEINYIAYQNNKPIGGITLAAGKQAAGLWNFAILENHRRQGVGSALIQTAWREAQKQGYDRLMAILMPSEIGNLWRQFHFQDICHFPFYIGYEKRNDTSPEKFKRVREKNLI